MHKLHFIIRYTSQSIVTQINSTQQLKLRTQTKVLKFQNKPKQTQFYNLFHNFKLSMKINQLLTYLITQQL